MDAVLECSVHGIISEQKVEQLRARLRGWRESEEVPTTVHEMNMRSAPFEGAPSSEIRLIQNLEHKQESDLEWRVRQYGAPQRGPGTEKLRAMVRGITESWCKGDAVLFFSSVGFSLQFEYVKRGLVFVCAEGGTPLTVKVVQICKLEEEGNVATAVPMSPNSWVVEVSVQTSTESYAAACARLGLFSDRPALASLVQLTKPHIPPGRPPPIIRIPPKPKAAAGALA
mmetsp:Transcript_18641/g.31335  ORF Transcript_18641/g.31335 Transcript_18641/m.31335 type:complete len:227 (+) Transcript_18641:201-881(+)|eukprot:CAMPEP_0198224960 /NCGR_PEP_ID=MMETSP1445-20131203/99069_1 /TAXON_ID=36898 /ORGANISM="Pyramimonas sp., Strain CCMP2087" /LENGTH=226 /DNA_ID=CAMNT_0043904309 /DNA_START=148 /DNA_END=828 /DNA_ORIENTATION=-